MRHVQSKSNDVSPRAIFLNLFTISFIIMVYVSLSNLFGSSSTYFIETPNAPLLFGISLMIFAFFSNLAGPYRSLIAGVLGELLYQFAYLNVIHVEWCILMGIFGFICGLNEYKPLKYLKLKNIVVMILVFFLASLGGALILFLFNLFLPEGGSSPGSSIFDSTGYFILHGFISTVLVSLPLLIVYDFFLSRKERIIYNELLTHHLPSQSDHAFYLQFGRTYIFFCSRCSGVIIGGLFSIFITTLLENGFNIMMSPDFAVLVCMLLPIPGMIDWGTQRLLYRTSNTRLRLLTGFILGIALHFMSFTAKYALFMLFLLIFYFSLLGILIYFGHKRELKLSQEKEDKEGLNNSPSFDKNLMDP
ncbi:MAG: DUF2085 domain-containing protein [Promethearchaeota archaeon]